MWNLEIPTEAAFLTKKNKTFNANYHNKTEKYLCILVLGKSKSSLFTYFTCRGTTKVKWPENTDTSPCKMKLCYAFVMVRNVLLKTYTFSVWWFYLMKIGSSQNRGKNHHLKYSGQVLSGDFHHAWGKMHNQIPLDMRCCRMCIFPFLRFIASLKGLHTYT